MRGGKNILKRRDHEERKRNKMPDTWEVII